MHIPTVGNHTRVFTWFLQHWDSFLWPTACNILGTGPGRETQSDRKHTHLWCWYYTYGLPLHLLRRYLELWDALCITYPHILLFPVATHVQCIPSTSFNHPCCFVPCSTQGISLHLMLNHGLRIKSSPSIMFSPSRPVGSIEPTAPQKSGTFLSKGQAHGIWARAKL